MTGAAVSAHDLGKLYRLGAGRGSPRAESLFRYKSLRETLVEKTKTVIGRPSRSTDAMETSLWALRGVSFEIRTGDVVGIIGPNGAGKSTLLKILSRITEPSEGYVDLHGRVGSLLEVGTGFHPELTGRENVFLNGAILGMRVAEIARKFDEIVAFAEVEKFLDTPVKHYSSGMYVRLAFAVAAHLEPEILVVDEVLAVGDASFQKKCLGRMSDISHQGRTILFVSHNMQAVRQLCSHSILLDGGRIVRSGSSQDVIDHYLAAVGAADGLSSVPLAIAALPPDEIFRLRDIRILQDGKPLTDVVSGKPVVLELEYDVLWECVGFHVYFDLRDAEGLLLFQSIHNGDETEIPRTLPGRYVSRATIPADFLAPTSYELSIDAGIYGIRHCIPKPIKIRLTVANLGRVNRAYPGYRTPGRLAPLIDWRTERREPR